MRDGQTIAAAIGLDDLTDIEFEDLFTSGDEIQARVEARLLEKTSDEWDRIFAEAGAVGGGVWSRIGHKLKETCTRFSSKAVHRGTDG